MDDYTREMMDLKTLVTRTLEKKGVLAKIRGPSYFGSSIGAPDVGSQLSLASRRSMLSGSEEVDMDIGGYRSHPSGALGSAAHYGGQYGAAYGTALSGAQQKKKKKKVLVQDPVDDAVDKLAEKIEGLSVADGLEPTFSGMKKKKKKHVDADFLNDENGDAGEDLDGDFVEDEEGEGIVLQVRYPWEGSDRDYKYEERRKICGRYFPNLSFLGPIKRTVLLGEQLRRSLQAWR